MSKIGKLDKNMKTKTLKNNGDIRWYNPTEKPFKISGLAFFEKDKIYRRLPISSENSIGKVNGAVNKLSWHTAGVQIRFKTTSSKICLKAVIGESPMSYHMTAIMEGGFDCYVKFKDKEQYEFTGVTAAGREKTKYEVVISENLGNELKEVIINFPLYGAVKEIFIGLPEEAEVLDAEDFSNKGRIVAYGTSITQGGCASRPGMAYTNILSRRLDNEIINLGFSGNGKGEQEVIDAIATIDDVSMYILDYEANAGDLILENLGNVVDTLRKKNPETPILIISKIKFCNCRFNDEDSKRFIARGDFQRDFVAERQNKDKNIYYIDGRTLFDDDCWYECTVDGVHPTDLGFYQMSNKIEPVIRDILKI